MCGPVVTVNSFYFVIAVIFLVNFHPRQNDYCSACLVEKVLHCFNAEWGSVVILLELDVYHCSPSGQAKSLITIRSLSVCVYLCACACVYLSVVMQDRGNESSD